MLLAGSVFLTDLPTGRYVGKEVIPKLAFGHSCS